ASHRATDSVRIRDQPQDRQGPRLDHSAVAPDTRGSGDRVMERRTFLGVIAGGLLAAPLAAEAQQAQKISKVGDLWGGSPASAAPYVEAFEEGLRDLGWVRDQNVAIEYRFAEGKTERYPDLVAELVRLNVDLIVAPGPPARVVRDATSTIPVVF